MKVVYFNSYYAPYFGGGAEVTLQQQVEAIKSVGNDVLVISLGPKKGINFDVVNGVDVVRIGVQGMYFPLENKQKSPNAIQRIIWHTRDRDNILIAQMLKKLLIDYSPDVASCHNLAGLSVAVWRLLSELNIPIVQVLHDQYLLCPKTTMVRNDRVCQKQCLECALFRLKHRKLSRYVNVLVGVSNYIVEKFQSYDYFPNARKMVINNVRRPELWSGKGVNRPRSQIEFCFGFIGSIVPIKGIEMLLDEFLSSNFDGSVKLIIAGKGNHEYVKTLQVKYDSPNITWLGHVTPSAFFEKIDALVVPSIWHDTLPGVVFEAFGFGVPVIGSNRGGIPEMIKNGENGFVFNPDDAGSLTERMRELLADRALVRRLSEGASRSVEKYKDVDRWVNSYIDAYSSAINIKHKLNSA